MASLLKEIQKNLFTKRNTHAYKKPISVANDPLKPNDISIIQ